MAGQTELQLPARKSSAFSICRGIQERRYTLCLRKSLLSPQRPLLPKLLRQSRRSARLPIPHSAAAAPRSPRRSTLNSAPVSTTSPMSSSAPRPTTAPPTRWASSPARSTSSPKRALPTMSSTRSPANWTCNFSAFRVPRTARRSTNKTRKKRFCRTPAEAFCFFALMPCYFFALPQRNFRFCSGSGSGISNT